MGFDDNARVPELRLSFYWDDKRKGWVVISRRAGATAQTHRIESTAPIDVAGEYFIVTAVAQAMEGWLF